VNVAFPFRLLRCIAVACALVATVCFAADETNSPVQALGGGRFAIGLVSLDQTNRTVSFPATVNLLEETVEYAVVHRTGKTHESIFRTSALPQDIHLAMLLLGTKFHMTNRWGADGQGQPIGDSITIEVAWTNAGKAIRIPIEDTVLNKQTGKTAAHGAWIYNGSNFSEGMFTAQRDGSIISIHIDPDALINNPRPGRENDDLFRPNAAILPPIGKNLVVTIHAAKAK
jgi:hypothetical protein